MLRFIFFSKNANRRSWSFLQIVVLDIPFANSRSGLCFANCLVLQNLQIVVHSREVTIDGHEH